ncbi:MAG TPA: VWA domain-containing protein [Pyrinomonadaceae bacterium]|nr:VWA domain-containing protein [Pyrinomonadaceae bacterium]
MRQLPCFITTLLLSIALLATPARAQQSREKPRLKDFGSSLKKLKWDPETNRTTEVQNSRTSSNDDDVIKIDTLLVAADLLVLDKQGNTVRGLAANDFSITEDGVPQQVGHFLLGDTTGISRSIVLIIDYSGSQFPYIKNSVEAAKVLVDQLKPADQMAIVTDDVQMLIDFTNDKRELKKKLDLLVERSKGSDGFLGIGGTRRRFGNSAQYSALMATLKEAFSKEDQRPIIIFQTDGDEAMYLQNSIVEPSVPPGTPLPLLARVQEEVEQRKKLQRAGRTEFSLDDVYEAVEKSRATIYTIVPGAKLIGLSPAQLVQTRKTEDERAINEMLPTLRKESREAFRQREEARKSLVTDEMIRARADEDVKVQQALAAVAPLAGGWTDFLERPEQAQTIYSRILSDINQRYIIGYYPVNKLLDGKRHAIKFEVKGHPEYTIVGRKSYYAPSPRQ